jgi:glycosyltransferase involved in cell wall biosynthesis
MRLSIVIPVYNEEASLPELVHEIEQQLQAISLHDYELLFIDDGSTDSTWGVIEELSQNTSTSISSHIRAWRLQYNCGKATALSLGFREAIGDVVITMDGDLQDNPQEIPALLQMIDDGLDLVSGWKQKRHDPWHKTMPSKVFNLVTSMVSGIRLHDFNCGLKAYKKSVVKSVLLYGDFHRYIPVMANWMGFKVGEKVVEHRPRVHGVSKYGISRLFSGGLDLLTLFFLHRWAVKPLHFFGLLGLVFGLAGSTILAYFGVEWVLKGQLHVRPLMLMGGFSMVMGIQFLSLGLLGEMITSQSNRDVRAPVASTCGGRL